VEVLTGANATGVATTETAGAGMLRLEEGREVAFDALLVATGRSPRTQGLGLESAGIDTDDVGHIIVNGHLQSTNPWVWAAGDVTGRSPVGNPNSGTGERLFGLPRGRVEGVDGLDARVKEPDRPRSIRIRYRLQQTGRGLCATA
jgi:hypothetical protein